MAVNWPYPEADVTWLEYWEHKLNESATVLPDSLICTILEVPAARAAVKGVRAYIENTTPCLQTTSGLVKIRPHHSLAPCFDAHMNAPNRGPYGRHVRYLLSATVAESKFPMKSPRRLLRTIISHPRARVEPNKRMLPAPGGAVRAVRQNKRTAVGGSDRVQQPRRGRCHPLQCVYSV